ncbi:MAG: vWA domain-containing protein [Crinalium sp.]
MIDSSIQKLKQGQLIALVATLMGLLPLPAVASSVDIYRWTTKGDRVTLRVKVLDDERIPVQGLISQNFQVQTTDKDGNTVTLKPNQIRLISPEQSQPEPAYLVLLLDMSGSMLRNDLSSTQKLKGATDGIRSFINEVRTANLPVQISVVPFGEAGSICGNVFKVNAKSIEQKFYPATSSELDNQLTVLANTKACAATNIYQPVTEAVKYLGERFKVNPDSENSQEIPPKMGVILLSDGFDVYRNNEKKRFQNLLGILRQNPQVIVHTLGYGERLNELRDRVNCPLSDKQLTVDNVSTYCKLRDQNINEYIVDGQRLKQIAQATGGIHKFPQDSQEVADSLKTFLTTLREYEINYKQPGADRATKHSTTVKVNSSSRKINNIASEPRQIAMGNFIYTALPFKERLNILGFTALAGIAGFFIFKGWSKNLKGQAERNLQQTDQ